MPTTTAFRLIFILLLFASPAAFAQDFAVEQLENSPRHHEWIEIESGDRTIRAFAAFPERSENTPAVLVIHENRGLSDWVRSFADQLAAAGYLAVAPDLLSDFDDDHKQTSDFESSDVARDAIYRLDPEQVIADLKAVQNHLEDMPSSTGDVVVAGFCWGGSQTFRYATQADDLEAALVFYGSAPEEDALIEAIAAPVYGFYGGDDQRVNATIEATQEVMEKLGKTYEVVVYDGAGHGFMRSGDDPDAEEADKEARDAAWDRLKTILAGVDE